METGEEEVIPSPVTSELFVFASIETSRSSLRIDRPICFRLRVQRISMVASSMTPQILLQSGVFWMAALPRRNTYLSLTILTQSNWLDSDFTMVGNLLLLLVLPGLMTLKGKPDDQTLIDSKWESLALAPVNDPAFPNDYFLFTVVSPRYCCGFFVMKTYIQTLFFSV